MVKTIESKINVVNEIYSAVKQLFWIVLSWNLLVFLLGGLIGCILGTLIH